MRKDLIGALLVGVGMGAIIASSKGQTPEARAAEITCGLVCVLLGLGPGVWIS